MPRRHSTSSTSDSYSLSSMEGGRPNGEKRHNGGMDDYETGSTTSDERDYPNTFSVHEPMLHQHNNHSSLHKSERPLRSLLSSAHYPYRIPARIMRYLCLGLAGSIVVLMLVLVRAGVNSGRMVMELGKDKPPPPPTWESFRFLRRYHGGLRTLVGKEANVPEYPREDGDAELPEISSENMLPVPKSGEYDPYPKYGSEEYTDKWGRVEECFLDQKETIPVPRLHAYEGVPMGMPENAYGSYDLLGLNNSHCFDRYGRYGPYGYGYTVERGGVSAGVEGEKEGAVEVWKGQEQIDYFKVNWGAAQRRCAEKNANRFKVPKSRPLENAWQTMHVGRQESDGLPSWQADFGTHANVTNSGSHKLPRQAVVIRTWHDFDYNIEQILYLRSLIAELALASGGEYTVHFLIHVKNNDIPIWADEETYQKVLTESLPPEFAGMGTLWSERQMEVMYSGVFSEKHLNLPVLGVYRAAHLPLQYFAHMHPEYDFFWNWEMDARYLGNWYEFFSKAGEWAGQQPRKGLWERNHRFYIPHVHGSWEDFKQMVRVQSEMAPKEPTSKWANMGPDGPQTMEPYNDKPVWGPRWPEGDLAAAPFEDDPAPPRSYDKDKYEWGVGEDADLIVFNPLFDPARTDWKLADDFSGYNEGENGMNGANPPRRTAIITAGRLSRRLLDRMHREVALRKHSMFTEMFAPTMCLHHGLKAVYVPHPVYIDREWPQKYLAATYNPGPNGVSGRHRATIFGDCCQHNLLGVTWYYHAGFAGNLWKRWWGIRVDGAGGELEEMDGEGRMCLPSMLFHPVKEVDLPVEHPPEAVPNPDEVAEHAVEGGS